MGSADLASNLDSDKIQDLIDFLKPLDCNGDVPQGNLEKIRKHLMPANGDPEFIREMKAALGDTCYVLEILHQVSKFRKTIRQTGLE